MIELDGFTARPVDLHPATTPEPRDGTSIESDRLRIDAAPDGTVA